jgi:hypothetical protein
MTIVILILATVMLLAAMLFLTVSVNEFEKKARSLEALIQKRYRVQSAIKSQDGAGKGMGQKKPPAQAKA